MTYPLYPGGCSVALYGGGEGPLSVWQAERDYLVRHKLGVHVHSSPAGLRDEGPLVLAEARDTHGLPVVFSIAGDMHVSDRARLLEEWRDTAALACGLGVPVLLNCEGRWKTPLHERRELAGEAMRMLRTEFPGLVVMHSAFDHPVAVPRGGGRWFGGHPYPWREFLRSDYACDVAVPQVYWGPGAPDDSEREPPGSGLRRLETHRESWDRAISAGEVSHQVAVMPYLQGYGVHSWDLCRVGAQYGGCVIWDAPQWDAHGREAAAALAEIYRRGYGGRGVEAFQRDAHLVADGLVGPRTLAALGVG